MKGQFALVSKDNNWIYHLPLEGNINSALSSIIADPGSSFLFDEKDNVNIKLFLTSGSLWDSDYTIDSKFKLRSSAGISLDFITAIGPISFSYAVPINKELNDNPRNFSFQIGSSF